jgi:glutamyl-tRNA reductase
VSSLRLVGVSHHVAPVDLRGKVALDLDGSAALARVLAADGREAVCLSTCNRTEVYVVADDGDAAAQDAHEALVELSGGAAADLVPVLYRLSDEAAALHLFRVAAGLDSMVPGEGEILGQVRAAYEAGSAGPILDRLFRHAVHVGKKARSETAIAESPASVPSAAAALAQQVFGELGGRTVLLIGAGTAGELAARSLAAREATIGCVLSRSLERAEEVARSFGARAATLDRVEDELPQADVVVSSTGAPAVVLERAQVERTARGRRGRPLLLVDIALPRDLDPGINEVAGCYLYDMDDLEAVVAESLAGRRREAARAEALAAEEAERFGEWHASRDVVPAIASLRAQAEEIRARELARAEGRLSRLSEPERRAVESVTAQIVNKLLHLPTVRMKEAAATADGPAYVTALEHLFGLDEKRE